ncbi:hypothetical protein [Tateyamaria sp. ANG-S1]|uniref:hypothetical protein n=1 Tax=Tateyamaria sp. ANG-S1 TaxID=1577905 RepID=UPI0005832744|nr:hypothetical protein [Tateyamaria sp. ANG-S1]KIC51054.1 hypothetical protein RA29_04020 [Tateyamaria sp. ANG-S1]
MKDTAPQHHTKQTTVQFNWMDWLPYLEDEAANDAQKRELIEALWSIILAFVDLGWDINSTPETCGETIDLKAALEAAVLSSEASEKHNEEATREKE